MDRRSCSAKAADLHRSGDLHSDQRRPLHLKTPKDIFPNIDIPVVSVIFNFAGMSPDQVEAHITSPYERVLTTTVDDIQHIESQSLYGIVVIKVFMQPTASLSKAVAQITAISQTILRQLPTGTTPPLIISYTASNVPVIRVGLGRQESVRAKTERSGA